MLCTVAILVSLARAKLTFKRTFSSRIRWEAAAKEALLAELKLHLESVALTENV